MTTVRISSQTGVKRCKLFIANEIQQFASKHKPQTFSRVCLRLKRGVYRWKRKCFTAHATCYSEKANSIIFHVLMCFRVLFNVFKLTILKSDQTC
jgi:hypothetical protein